MMVVSTGHHVEAFYNYDEAVIAHLVSFIKLMFSLCFLC